MQLQSFVFNPFYENTYVAYDAGEAIVIDPGCYETYEQRELQSFIESQHLTIKAIVNTHCHIDHVLGNDYTMRQFKAPLWIPEGEVSLLKAVEVYAPQYGMHRYVPTTADKLLSEKDMIKVGNAIFQILFVPGHAPGHIALYHADSQKLIAGDVLFRESIGRTDLPGGNFEQLAQSIRTKIYTLPDQTEVFPGHGPSTTVAHEKKHNPFVPA